MDVYNLHIRARQAYPQVLGQTNEVGLRATTGKERDLPIIWEIAAAAPHGTKLSKEVKLLLSLYELCIVETSFQVWLKMSILAAIEYLLFSILFICKDISLKYTFMFSYWFSYSALNTKIYVAFLPLNYLV